jgi:short-subunit dehydrogenase
MNIVLTGASRGIGYQTALALCSYPIENLILIARNKTQLGELKNECIKINKQVNIITLAVDLSSIELSQQTILKAISFETLDVLINNAGVLLKRSFLETDFSDAGFLFKMNTLVPSYLVRMFSDYLLKSNHSHIVNIGSMGGFQGSKKFVGLSYYSASKAALACITECLAEEFSGTPVSVNCLALGSVNTEMLAEAFPGYIAPVNASEMGKFIAEFALNGHRFFNGKIIPVTLSTP